MKQLKKLDKIYLEQYEVMVFPCLTMRQAELIAKGVCALETTEFLERKMNEDMLLLYHVTDIGEETLQSTPYEDLVESGLIATVRSNIKNIGLIQECVNYTESFARTITLLAPKITPIIEKFGDLNGYNENFTAK